MWVPVHTVLYALRSALPEVGLEPTFPTVRHQDILPTSRALIRAFPRAPVSLFPALASPV